MAKKKAAAKKTDEPSFEDALAELEAVVGELESGELGLEEALARYETGVARLRRCHTLLEQAERRIEVLSGFDSEGRPVTEPLDASEDPTADGGARAARRSRPAGKSSAAKGPAKRGVDDSPGLF